MCYSDHTRAMLTNSDIIYYLVYSTCLIFSFRAREVNIPGLVYLRLILCLGLVNEMVVESLQYLHKEENPSNYIYIPIEYFLLVLFYIQNTHKKRFRKALYLSIPLYVIVTVLFIVYRYHFKGYPSAIYNVSCLLNTIWLVRLFLDIDVVDHLPVFKLPLFWLYTALLIFYSGLFFFNGAYGFFVDHDSKIAESLRGYIALGLNYILYSVLTYAFICSRAMKKY